MAPAGKIFRHWGRAGGRPGFGASSPVPKPRGAAAACWTNPGGWPGIPCSSPGCRGLEEITPWLDKIREVQESPLVLSEQQRQVRIDGVVEEATRPLPPGDPAELAPPSPAHGLFPGPPGPGEDARVAQAAAHDLAERTGGPLAGENPFLKALVQHALRLAWEFRRKPGSPSPPPVFWPRPMSPCSSGGEHVSNPVRAHHQPHRIGGPDLPGSGGGAAERRQRRLCHIFVPHTTAGVTINENADPSVKADILMVLNKLISDREAYRHLEGNSPAHIKASLMGPHLTVLVSNGRLVLGTWQGIFFCEFDGPRTRRLHLKIVAG